MSDDTQRDELGRLHQEMIGAEDAQILRIVRFVDALPERDLAGALIEPLRSRLEALRPDRPLTLARLLFLPLDPLIIAPDRWRSGAPGIPRTALAPLTAAVTEALGPLGADVCARIAGRQTRDVDVVADAGEILWPAAAAALRRWVPQPGSGTGTALDAAALAALASSVGGVLAHGGALYRFALRPDATAEAAALLRAAAGTSAAALDLMLAVLLAQTLDAGPLLHAAEELAAGFGLVASERALDFALGSTDSDDKANDEDIAGGTKAICRVAILLDGMERQAPADPRREVKLARLRERLDRSCRQRFEAGAEGLGRTVLDGAVLAADDAMAGIEAAAVELRWLEALAQHVGGTSFDDTPLHRAADRLAVATGLPPLDRLRLAEILLGADAALTLAERSGLGATEA